MKPADPSIWDSPAVKLMVAALEGLADGSKRLVIESKASQQFPNAPFANYKHTFKIEDTK